MRTAYQFGFNIRDIFIYNIYKSYILCVLRISIQGFNKICKEERNELEV